MLEQDRIIKINIEEEMKSSYIDYSMSVIVARALPDVRDGFKPVHRRILYGMIELGNTSDKAYKKSARIVGEVLGKYHPHGDSSVYGALVRMAQDWAMRYPLVDGQGNFGSVDGDSPAAMRYTEARLKKIGEEMMQDLYKETVDFQNNFDDTLQEPTVMPTRIPNLLVNGASGIAVGMATNMPTHNLSEVIDACIAYIDNNDIDIEGLMQYVKAPDFPTGGYIYGISGVRDAYETGRGRVVMRAKAEIETHTTHDKIIVNEIPYNVNKKELIENIASLVNDKKIDGISYVNDESDREGMRIVIDVKRDANASVVLNKLFKMTALQTSFGVNNIALVHGRPKMLNLKDLIRYFVEHRHDVVIRRTQYDLRKAQERAHILEGLIIASDNIDEVIRIIRAAKTPNDAIAGLIERFNLSEIQARAIVEMRLRQLTGLMQDQLHAEYEEVMKQIAYYEEILSNDELCKKVIKDELVEVKEKYGDARRSEIVYSSEEFNPEDFYADDHSAKWLEVIKEGTESFPKQEYFVGNIMDYYIQKGMVDEGLAQINKLLATSETPYYLYVKGILLYEKKQYDDAVAIFNKIISNNGDLVAEAYSKIGDCYFFPAQIIVEENAKLAIDDPKYNENENKIKELYEKAKPYYEKAKELKPDNKALWGNYLLNIYWKLNRAEYDSLEKELGY